MNEQTLKPFKAYFEYSQKGCFKDYFDELFWSRLFDGVNIRTVKSIVHNSSDMFKIPYILSDSKINLDFKKIHSVTPENVSLNDRSQYFSFKFNSKPIKVLQIAKDDVTFENDKSEIHTITLNNNLKLIKTD